MVANKNWKFDGSDPTQLQLNGLVKFINNRESNYKILFGLRILQTNLIDSIFYFFIL